MTNLKREIVSRLIKQIPDQDRETVDQAMVSWWVNIRDSGGLRLTQHGYNLMKNVLEIESWTVTIEDAKQVLNKRAMLDLDRKLTWPYYVDTKNKCLVLFSSKEAMMAGLYGDLHHWLKNCGYRLP